MSILQSRILVIFPKGLIHGLSWKIKMFFVKIDLEIFFADGLYRKKGFPD